MQLDPIFERCFEPIKGLPCWQVKQGCGSFLTLEFGEPHLEIREPYPTDSATTAVEEFARRRNVTIRGQWHLWIYCCRWSVTNGEQEVGSSDLDESIEKATRFLDGQQLKAMTISPLAGSSFQFDLGGTLSAFPYDETSEQWMLYQPNGFVLTLRANGTYSHTKGSTHPDDENWIKAWRD